MKLDHLNGKFALIHTVTFAFAGKVEVLDNDTAIVHSAIWVENVVIPTSLQTCHFDSKSDNCYMPNSVTVNLASVVYVTELPTLPKSGK